ncbi:MAG: gliding motility protein GldM [Bacteroidetes bacterium]|nr:MAG: gliding motility protein GldM [Bacteroidota bacterium]
MSLPREPRQKMINMMYLVLTALLALNVSAEILNAFKTVNKSLETTNATVNNSTTAIMQSLEDKQNDPKTAEKAAIWLPKAKAVQEYAKSMNTFIQSLKNEIIKEGGGDPDKSSFKADNLDIATRLMLDKGKAKELLAKLTEFKKNILKNVDPSIDSAFSSTLPIYLEIPKGVSKSNNTWERAYFHMVPTVAALTILSKFQNDVKTSENKIVEFCHNKVDKVVVRYDTYAAFAQSNSSYVMPGDEMEVTAGVGAFSKAALPTVTIAGAVTPLGDDGAAHKLLNAESTLGEHSINVNVEYTDQEGKKQTILKTIKYTVGQSAASIALDKMNVLYIGVDNPVSIAASGGGSEAIQVSISGAGGALQNLGKGKYIARVNSVTDDCKITVTVGGKVAGASVFRTRTIPKPIAVVGPYESGASINANAFKAQAGVGAGIKDFPFELKYQVTRFILSADNDEGYIDEAPCQGNLWSSAAQAVLSKLKSGRTITIDDIYATGPDGRSQKLPSLVYYIK